MENQANKSNQLKTGEDQETTKGHNKENNCCGKCRQKDLLIKTCNNNTESISIAIRNEQTSAGGKNNLPVK
jgi:hypothetical protein